MKDKVRVRYCKEKNKNLRLRLVELKDESGYLLQEIKSKKIKYENKKTS